MERVEQEANSGWYACGGLRIGVGLGSWKRQRATAILRSHVLATSSLRLLFLPGCHSLKGLPNLKQFNANPYPDPSLCSRALGECFFPAI